MIDAAFNDRAQIDEVAFPRLTSAELALVKPLATPCDYADGETVFRAGQAEIDLYIIESGQMEIRNPTGGDGLIVTHGPGQFSGDIDLLTGRPVMVNAVARGATRVLRVPNSHLRTLLNRVPSFGEKLITALTRRRELLSNMGTLGLRVVGPLHCRDTNTVREFLYKNFVPFTWFDTATAAGQELLTALGSPQKTPVIECAGGRVLVNPSLQELANEAGIWRHCPSQEADFVIIGAGPAGIAAAVYASSEGLSTLVLDKLGPGGQAGASSRIENFIGFPAGLSGADLATRGVLQMLKFGARMVAPVNVERLTPARPSASRTGSHWIAAPRFAAGYCYWPWACGGESWKPREQTVLPAPASIMPAQRWKPTFTTAPTSALSAAATPPDRPRCSWPSAVRRERSIC